jgi:hypothetical protein
MSNQSNLITKIYAGFALLLVLLIVVAVVGYVGFVRIVDRIEMSRRIAEMNLKTSPHTVMDGESATREIRKKSGFAKLPILAMTTNAINVFEESAHLLRSVFGSALTSAESSLNDWDFSAALQALPAAKADRDELK